MPLYSNGLIWNIRRTSNVERSTSLTVRADLDAIRNLQLLSGLLKPRRHWRRLCIIIRETAAAAVAAELIWNISKCEY